MAAAKDRSRLHDAVKSGKETIEVSTPVLKSLLDAYEDMLRLSNISRELVGVALKSHPWPWRVELDWGQEILDANNKRVALLMGLKEAEAIVEMARREHEELEEARKMRIEDELAEPVSNGPTCRESGEHAT